MGDDVSNTTGAKEFIMGHLLPDVGRQPGLQEDIKILGSDPAVAAAASKVHSQIVQAIVQAEDEDEDEDEDEESTTSDEAEACPECGSIACLRRRSAAGARELWEIPQDFDLGQNAADFYLLLRLELDGQLDKAKFQAWVLETAEPLLRYTRMAIGGELRHCIVKATPRTPLEKSICAHYHGKRMSDRTAAWCDWHAIVKEAGSEAYAAAASLFGSKRQSCGGYWWQLQANKLYLYETHQISLVLWLDQMWHAVHNGGSFFSKISYLWGRSWNTDTLQIALDANAQDEVDELMNLATPKVGKMWADTACAS